MSKVREPEAFDDCWEWLGNRNPDRLGVFGLGGRMYLAHRVGYTLFRGEIPAGLVLDHQCDVSDCVNPFHVEPATNRENVLRGRSFSATNARKTHCDRGHELAGDNLYRHGPDKRWRACKACRRAARERRREEAASS